MAAGPLMRELNLTDREIRRRLDIVGFGPADLKGVLAVSDVVAKHAEEHVTLFFDYLKSLGGPSALLEVPEIMEIARRLKADHLRAIAGGVYGASYVEERRERERGLMPPRDFRTPISGILLIGGQSASAAS